MEATKYMIDTDAGDYLYDNNLITRTNKLIEKNIIEILVTNIQEDQWEQIPEKKSEKKKAIQKLKWTKIPSSANLLGISKFDQSTFGDGSESGLNVDKIKTEENHHRDSLIGSTAEEHADFFVAIDNRFSNQMEKKSSVKVLSGKKLKNRIMYKHTVEELSRQFHEDSMYLLP